MPIACRVAALALCCMPALTFAGPAYTLEPGTALTFETTSTTTGSMKSTGRATVHAWVLSINADGSRRVLLKTEISYKRDDTPNNDEPARVELMAVDIAPDGRLNNATRAYLSNPAMVFPPLPPGDAKAWQAEGQMGGTMHYRPADDSPAGQFKIVAESAGPMNDIYGGSDRTVHTIDLARGLPVAADGEQTQTYGFQTKSAMHSELKSATKLEPAALKSLASDSQTYFDTVDRYGKLMQAAEADAAKLDEAKAVLNAATGKLSDPLFKDAIAKDAKHHEQQAGYARESAAERAKMLNQPSPDWTLKDLQGNTHKLADYRGKVIILDFWYRGCGWCIRAMPQINQLAGDMKDKPVAVLGMNNDAKTEDAQFVADKMHLAYPTLLAGDLPKTYGVRGFPTLLIIDRQGVVRDLHVGYSPTLRQDVTERIEKLLK